MDTSTPQVLRPDGSTTNQSDSDNVSEVAPPQIIITVNGFNDIQIETDSRLDVAAIAAVAFLLERMASMQFTTNVIAQQQAAAQQAQELERVRAGLNREMRRHPRQ